MSIFEEVESEVRSYCRSFPTVFDTAEGSHLYTKDGRDYLDFFDGAGALNYGHNNPYLMDKVVAYIQKKGITHALDMSTAAKEEFLTTFRNEILAPRGMDHKVMFCGSTGTNAVEAALKLARKVTGRDTIFAFSGAFHGMSMGSLSVTSGNDTRESLRGSQHAVVFMPFPYGFNASFDTIGYIRNVLNDDHSGIAKPAAIILETVQAEGGVIVADPQWLRDLRALCDEYGILLICDEIQVGCGRTGTFFSFERAGIIPDMITGEHNGTFRGNQLAFVAGKAALDFMKETDLLAQVKKKEAIIREFMETEILPLDSRLSVRGIGMIWGIEFEKIDYKLSKVASMRCFENGLLIERAGRRDSVLKPMPALTIPEEDLRKGLAIVKEAVEYALKQA